MEELYREFGGRMEFIGINLGNREDIGEFMEKYGLSFPVAYDEDERLRDSFRARIPTNVVIDQNGEITYKSPKTPDRQYLEGLTGPGP